MARMQTPSEQIAGSLDLSAVMDALSTRRPVFHSEADFQFAFAQSIVAADPTIEVRLEARPTSDGAEYVDLACWTESSRTLIEFKYATAGWRGTDPYAEAYTLRNHAAYDLARRFFVQDISRLERLTSERDDTNGIAIMLTNEPSLWANDGRETSRDAHFRVHEGQALTGHLVWGTGDSPQHDQHLRGTYTTSWRDYSELEGPKGSFRWLGVAVNPANPTATELGG